MSTTTVATGVTNFNSFDSRSGSSLLLGDYSTSAVTAQFATYRDVVCYAAKYDYLERIYHLCKYDLDLNSNGVSDGTPRVGVFRFLNNGTLDTDFGGGAGEVYWSNGGTPEDIWFSPDWQAAYVVIAAQTSTYIGKIDIPNRQIDAIFGSGSLVHLNYSGSANVREGYFGLSFRPNGDLLLSGGRYDAVAVNGFTRTILQISSSSGTATEYSSAVANYLYDDGFSHQSFEVSSRIVQTTSGAMPLVGTYLRHQITVRDPTTFNVLYTLDPEAELASTVNYSGFGATGTENLNGGEATVGFQYFVWDDQLYGVGLGSWATESRVCPVIFHVNLGTTAITPLYSGCQGATSKGFAWTKGFRSTSLYMDPYTGVLSIAFLVDGSTVRKLEFQ